MTTTVNLGLLQPRDVTITGSTKYDNLGLSVASIGDFNGDGFDDIIIKAYVGGANNREQAYVVFGRPSGMNTTDLANLRSSDGFAIEGNWTTYSVAGAGDVNGDGFDDIIVGKAGGDPYYNSGGTAKAYIIFGNSRVAADIDLDNFQLSDDTGFVLRGVPSQSYTPFVVSGAGDVNHDGYADILVGASAANNEAGAGYVIFGKASKLGTIEAGDIAPATGFVIQGALANEALGSSVSAAGDVNHDGFADLIVGAPGSDAGGVRAGAAYVVLGHAGTFAPVNVHNLAANAGFMIQGDLPFDNAGFSVASAGDVNGDGFDDVIIGAPWQDDGSPNAGAAYVVFGKAGLFTNIDLGSLGAAGCFIRGDAAGDTAGYSVSGAGDLNGDGIDDIVIGAPGNRSYSGAAYVIFGKLGGFGSIDLADVAPATGMVLQGANSGDQAGFSVSNGGDINHDGHSDLLIGVPFSSSANQGSGRALIMSLSAPVAPATNDFNADGRSDLLWRDANDTLFNWVATANGGFVSNAAAFSTTIATDLKVAGIGDFNGDGIADILWRQDGTGRIQDWLGTGNGGYADNSQNFSSSLPANVKITGIGDFNGDGRDDLLLRSDTGMLFDWLGQANGSFASSSFSTSLSPAWQVASVGDYNGDGRDDILWREDSTGRLLDWLGTATGGFITNDTNFSSSAPSDLHVAGSGDFNGDGIEDILWRQDNGLVFTWMGNDRGGFASNAGNFATTFALDWKVASIGDFDGDGRADILWRQDATGNLVDWLGTANGGFISNSPHFASSVPTGVVMQDPFL